MKLSGYLFEFVLWTAALLALLFSDVSAHHFTLCPLALSGCNWCPGCGIGRAVALLLHGEVLASFRMHWFGIPALLILLHRLFVLSKHFLKTLEFNY